jgi:GNAT superfamily N-acetyltransferase
MRTLVSQMEDTKALYNRSNSLSSEYLKLMQNFDAELRATYGNHQDEADKQNVFEEAINIVLVYHNDKIAGCGGYKPHHENTAEIKRVYVLPEYRGKGLGIGLMNEIEQWAKEGGFKHLILETGDQQHEAIALYRKIGYYDIPKYAPYLDSPVSVCMRKNL